MRRVHRIVTPQPEACTHIRAGHASLPLLDGDDLSDINVALITHFHLDHCAAVPFLVASTPFRGAVYMTHATKSIFYTMMKDMLRMHKKDPSRQLFTAEQLEKTMAKISVINFHQTVEVDGIQITPYR
jgi:cleavage and polyadenylation specificity factor subunit 3